MPLWSTLETGAGTAGNVVLNHRYRPGPATLTGEVVPGSGLLGDRCSNFRPALTVSRVCSRFD